MAEEIRPEVSILIAAWNAEATIGAAVQSALDQQGVAVEVIVVDDASTDGTRALVARMAAADPRLRLVSQPQNAGPAAARNKALKMSAAPWVTVLDSDDVLAPHRLAGMLALARSEGWDFVADDLYKVDSHPPRGPRQRLWSAEPIGKLSLTFESFVRGNLSRLHGGKGELGFLKPLMRRGFLRDRGLSYAEDMRLGEDYALYATALARGAGSA